MRALYTVALRLALPFLVLRLWWRGRREPGYRESMSERFGLYQVDRPERLLWIHAVSVGEARAAEPLVRALNGALPDHRILITCTTAAGRETIKQVYGEATLTVFLPYDFPEAAQAFLEYFRPRLAIVMETEVWPNLLARCARYGVPVMLANARLSERSARGYRRWRALAEPAFASLAAVCAQSAADAERLRAAGARSVEVTGNLKFDVTPDAGQLAAGAAWRKAVDRPVLLLASTREGEESMLLASRPADARLLVVVVPRHPRRFDAVAAMGDSRRSHQPMPAAEDRIHVGDSMGEMAFYYAACDVAIIGGSFAPLGGQNLIEALAAGAAVIVGPHMYNFAEATELAIQSGAARQVGDAAAAVRTALELLANQRERQRMSEAGRNLWNQHRGATARHLAICQRLLRL
ncbi:MAG TPA: 3-deoxy-D-manno-octulosonic acid transferase [Burkholderiales bacterium]|nr:3-deoxy-D-manno-octulosonic acid transferase [Burkholderiales bacterium]